MLFLTVILFATNLALDVIPTSSAMTDATDADGRSSQYRQPTPEAEAEAEVDPNDPDEIMRRWREGEDNLHRRHEQLQRQLHEQLQQQQRRRQMEEEGVHGREQHSWNFKLNGVRGG